MVWCVLFGCRTNWFVVLCGLVGGVGAALLWVFGGGRSAGMGGSGLFPPSGVVIYWVRAGGRGRGVLVAGGQGFQDFFGLFDGGVCAGGWAAEVGVVLWF